MPPAAAAPGGSSAAARGGMRWSWLPSFTPYGTDLYDLLTSAELRLSAQMIAWWGAFAWHAAPQAPGQPAWPAYISGQLMS
jgi:hypothetical protein